MRRLIPSGELQTICGTWLEQSIPRKGAVLNLPPSYPLRGL